MIWWIIGAITAFLVFRFAWRCYIHPAHVLGRQAANMNWFAIGRVEDDKGFKDVCYGRDGMEVKVSYASGRVFLVKPAHVEPFKDFIELERWLAQRENSSPNKNNSSPEVPIDSIDPKGIFRYIKKSQIDSYQDCLEKIFNSLDIDSKRYGYQWTETDGKKIAEIAKEADKKYGLHFIYLQTMLEQYLDADSMIRQLHRQNWVRTVTGFEKPIELSSFQDDFFPDAQTIFQSVRERFFK